MKRIIAKTEYYNKLFIKYFDFLEALDRYPFYTPKEYEIELDNKKKPYFINRICSIIKENTQEKGRLVFRGQKKSNLRKILVKDEYDKTDETLYNHLFLFGEKAACFYSINSFIALFSLLLALNHLQSKTFSTKTLSQVSRSLLISIS